jgi:hypothetical protein
MEAIVSWQKMDTAPRDGTSMIVWTTFDGFVPWISWKGNRWVSEDIAWRGKPIAWMPFPNPPAWESDDA